MKFPLLLTSEINNEEELQAIKNFIDFMKNTDNGALKNVIDRMVYRPGNDDLQARVRISNEVLATGSKSAMKTRFNQEVAMSPRSRIVYEEMVNTKWTIVRSTMKNTKA